MNEDPDEANEDVRTKFLKDFKDVMGQQKLKINNDNGNPMDDPDIRKSTEQEIEIDIDKNEEDFTPEERAQIEKMQKEQARPEFEGKDRKNNCKY